MKITVSLAMTDNEKFMVQVNSVDDEVPDYSNARRYQSKSYAFNTLAECNDFIGEVFKKNDPF